jgi:hypothetical protein
MKKNTFFTTLLAAAALFSATFAQADIATSLSGNSYIDDRGFIAISTVDTSQGTVVGSSTTWSTHIGFSGFTLLKDVDYFIHIFVDGGNYPNNVIGEFAIDSTTHEFANGTQAIGTNTVDWLWGTYWTNMNNVAKVSGDNFSANFSPTTQNIFRANTWPDYINTDAYFTTAIFAIEEPPVVSDVSGKGSAVFLALGSLLLAYRRFKVKA